MKITKKLLSLLLSVAMVLSLCVAVSADETALKAGHYALSSMEKDGTVIDSDVIALTGVEASLDINEDGTFSMSLNGDSVSGDWEGTTLTVDGIAVEATVSGDDVILEDNGTKMTFTLGDGSESTDPASAGDEDPAPAEDLGEPEILDKVVVLDNDVCKLTITGIEHNKYGYYQVSYTAENKTDKSITISCDYSFVNGMLNDGASMYISLDPNAKKKDTSSIYDSYLSGIDHIGKLGWVFDVYDGDTYDHLDETYPYGEVSTTLDGLFVQKIDDAGEIIMDTDDVKVVYQGVRVDSYDAHYIDFYVENKLPDTTVYVSADTLKYDGWQSNDSLYANVYKGSCGYFSIRMWSDPSDYDVESFDELNEMSISVKARDYDSYNTLGTSDEVTVSLKTVSPRA